MITEEAAGEAAVEQHEYAGALPRVWQRRQDGPPLTGVPIKSWARHVEDGAQAQAENLSLLPFAQHHVALMPDAHQGYGMPVGGVLFADRAVVPYAVGVDIGCGVALIETDMHVGDLNGEVLDTPLYRQGRVKQFLDQVARDVPVGNGPHGEHTAHNMLTRADGAILTFDGAGAVLPYPDRRPPLSKVAYDAIEYAAKQLGTLGGGNHFLELQADDEGRVWFMLHSGSRSVGKKVCDHWHRQALALNRLWHSALPHEELAWLPLGTPEFDGYMNDMAAAMVWAEENRRRMAGKVVSAFGTVFGAKAWPVLDVHHNYAAWESHFGRNGIVHRKGAVRAGAGETVLIPGSMSTGSYVAEGLGNPDSFETCQHGAGRARSRKATERMYSVDDMERSLAEAGVVLVTPLAREARGRLAGGRASIVDESAVAYKDIEDVMAASADLVRPVRRHRPLGVVKG